MKKLYALCFALLCCGALFAQDEEIDYSLRFVDAAGTDYPDGSELTLTTLTIDDFLGSFISSGLYVENTTSSAKKEALTMEVLNLSENSNVQFCAAGNCNDYDAIGTYTKYATVIANDKDDLMLEWFPVHDDDDNLQSGESSVTLMIELMDQGGKLFEAQGPTITVHFKFDATGIQSVADKTAKRVVARYNAGGQLIQGAQKGLNILQYEDGTTAKVLVK